jgi:hypothetical protein
MPDAKQVGQCILGKSGCASAQDDLRVVAQRGDASHRACEAMRGQHGVETRAVLVRHLHEHAELFVEQLGQRVAMDLDIETAAGGECHFTQGRPGPAIGAVMPGMQHGTQVGERVEEATHQCRVVEIGRTVAKLVEALRKDAASEPMPAPCQIEQPDSAGTDIGTQHRRQCAAHIGNSGQGLIVSGDRFVATNAEREALLVELPDALAVEMEGAAVAQVCHDFGVPLVVVRTVSDRADDAAHVDFPAFTREVASHYSAQLLRAWLDGLSAVHEAQGVSRAD